MTRSLAIHSPSSRSSRSNRRHLGNQAHNYPPFLPACSSRRRRSCCNRRYNYTPFHRGHRSRSRTYRTWGRRTCRRLARDQGTGRTRYSRNTRSPSRTHTVHKGHHCSQGSCECCSNFRCSCRSFRPVWRTRHPRQNCSMKDLFHRRSFGPKTRSSLASPYLGNTRLGRHIHSRNCRRARRPYSIRPHMWAHNLGGSCMHSRYSHTRRCRMECAI